MKRVGSYDNYHVQIVYQEYQLPSMAPRKIVAITAGPCGPPLIAVADILEVSTNEKIPGVIGVGS